MLIVIIEKMRKREKIGSQHLADGEIELAESIFPPACSELALNAVEGARFSARSP
jgi:hypothetical protein